MSRRPRPVRSRAGALVAVLLAAAALVAGPALSGSAPVAAAPGGPVPAVGPAPPAADPVPAEVQVLVDDVLPVVPTPTSLLVVTGRLLATTDQPVTDVAVRLRLSTGPLAGRSEIPAVVQGSTTRDGLSVPGTRVQVGDLQPGRQEPFRIEIAAADLPLRQTGVYVLGVEALGRLDGSFARRGLTRTFLPWVPRPEEVKPTGVVLMWPLADWPARDAEGVLLGDRTARELSPGGRLRTLADVGAGARDVVSWAIDPELLQTAQSMTQGYEVLVGGTVEPGDRTAEAAAFLDRVRTATAPAPATSSAPAGRESAGPSLRVLPYADVDAAALRRVGLERDAVRAVTVAPTVGAKGLGRPVTGGFAWPAGGQVDQPTLDSLSAAGVTTVVLSTRAAPPDPPVTFTPSGSATLPTSGGSVRAVLTDPGLEATLGMPQRTRDQVLLARQRFLAETCMITLELPGTPRTVVAAPASVRWAPASQLTRSVVSAIRTAPWMQPTSLDTLLAAAPSDVRRDRLVYPPAAQAAELPASYLARVSALQQDVAAFGSVVDDPTGLTEPFTAALLRAESTAWRTERRTGDLLLDRIESELAAQTDKVRLLSRGTVTFSGERGVVPVTVANDLDRPVTVGLRLVGSPPARLESEPVTRMEVEPGRKVSIEVEARVVGGGPLPVEVQLLTPDGQPYGEPAEIELRSTAYARAAAWVVGGAFVVLALFVVLSLLRRVRRGGSGRDVGGTTDPGPDESDGAVTLVALPDRERDPDGP